MFCSLISSTTFWWNAQPHLSQRTIAHFWKIKCSPLQRRWADHALSIATSVGNCGYCYSEWELFRKPLQGIWLRIWTSERTTKRIFSSSSHHLQKFSEISRASHHRLEPVEHWMPQTIFKRSFPADLMCDLITFRGFMSVGCPVQSILKNTGNVWKEKLPSFPTPLWFLTAEPGLSMWSTMWGPIAKMDELGLQQKDIVFLPHLISPFLQQMPLLEQQTALGRNDFCSSCRIQKIQANTKKHSCPTHSWGQILITSYYIQLLSIPRPVD